MDESTMSNAPLTKEITYEILKAYIDYGAKTLVLTNYETGESITIPSAAYPQLQAIMADIGREPPAQKTDANSRYGK